jgi:hypothetical protein
MEGYWKEISAMRTEHCFLKEVPKDFREKYERDPDNFFKKMRRKPRFWKRLFRIFF